ncbi:glycerol-3-phosphate 1-O-acyltransferase PlsY [Alicyclobacillus sp. SO9]|uniref:glycerol-3-phosphate 1-O-acyltransferase PlsY n=1 Tax=Alicyclobacillus sp. SO9 TaxID=2665646 RepID=UPI0018E85E2C|nr:glycerol-3-phosphate 1-O-acyltransferase PlsY [Alicyclobacillus sp. SO9]QQE77798.1 glycerol-3-phosphate 1-O-acyltransferase PlsY [Alicyclobacillus sp. SO9]
MVFAVGVILSYLIGSLSFSTIIGRIVAHIDIRQHGSGNAGATNTLRVLGVKWAILVLVLDIAKGVVVVLAASRWFPNTSPLFLYSCGIAVIVGHNWPVFFRFKGGKGVATTIGVLAVSMFHPAIIAGAFALALISVTRYVSLGSLSFTTLTSVLAAIMYPSVIPSIFGAIVAAFSILRHRQNIVRLWNGTERRIFEKKEANLSSKEEEH